MNDAEEFPQNIQECLQRENAFPLESWLNLNEFICGIEIEQITAKHLLLLHGIDSPFMGKGNATFEDVLAFLWIVSPSFSYEEKKQIEFVRQTR